MLLDNTLRIEDARPEDQGQYICKAHNEGGNVSVAVKLYVYGKKKRTSILVRYKSYYNRMSLPSENVCLCVKRNVWHLVVGPEYNFWHRTQF